MENTQKARNSSYYTFLAYQQMKYRENLENKKKEEFLLYKESVMKEMILYKQYRNLEKGNTYYIEKINNTVRDFQDNFIDKEELDNLLMVIQKEIVKSCNLSNQQLISLTKLINRERFTYLYLSDPCEFS
jgi:hypothetical protein